MEKKTFGVMIPTAGQLYVEVEAESEEEAKEKALSLDELPDGDHEWNVYEELNSGNVCHVETAWEIEVEEV